MLSIANEVDSLIFRYDTNMCFSNNWYQSDLQFWICITCFVSFGIRESNFMLLEDHTFNFLHGCLNYYFIKTDIDAMMLFKFDIKYVKLNFKAIASMVSSFDLKLNLLCSYDGSLFMKNHWKLLGENFGKIQFHEFQPIENSLRSIECSFSIDRIGIENQSSQADCLCWIYWNFDWSRIPFDRSNLPFRSIQ